MLVNLAQSGNVGTDVDVDLEAVIHNEGTEWVDVEVEPSQCFSDAGYEASWAKVVSKFPQGFQNRPRGDQGFGEEMVQHKAQVQLVFLAYHRVQSIGTVRIPLYQITLSVAQSVGGVGLDAVQPMQTGWYIYMRT